MRGIGLLERRHLQKIMGVGTLTTIPSSRAKYSVDGQPSLDIYSKSRFLSSEIKSSSGLLIVLTI